MVLRVDKILSSRRTNSDKFAHRSDRKEREKDDDHMTILTRAAV